MSIAQIRLILIKRIVEADEVVLKEILSLLKSSEEIIDEQMKNLPPPPNLKPLTEEELLAELEASNEEYKKGEYITLEELEKEMEKW